LEEKKLEKVINIGKIKSEERGEVKEG